VVEYTREMFKHFYQNLPRRKEHNALDLSPVTGKKKEKCTQKLMSSFHSDELKFWFFDMSNKEDVLNKST
jgi:hypothetical protein